MRYTLTTESWKAGNVLYEQSFFKRLAAWIALFSMAMLFIAPVISKSQMQQTLCTDKMSSVSIDMAHTHHDVDLSAHCTHGKMAHNILMPTTGMSPMEDIACGYCQLLIHLPFILLVIIALAWLLTISVKRKHIADHHRPRICRPWAPQIARAPPKHVFATLH
ncbi:DUF2946 domain-containing protein [Pectobacterium sp. B1J-3]|uniref:DUF2946 domain-containing protein n=1 Tax=Pectobacterium sp. B1J-3 TaxID=3385371 RepID=UPI003905D677